MTARVQTDFFHFSGFSRFCLILFDLFTDLARLCCFSIKSCMRFSDRGGGRRSMHPSKSTTVPVIVFIVLLCDLPLPSTASTTRSPRSCHRPVAGDRIALPASMTRRPAVVAGPVDSAGTPQSAYTTGGQASAPCRHSCRASILRGTDQHESNWPGNAVPTASSTPSTSSGSGGIRQSDGLLRVARRRRSL